MRRPVFSVEIRAPGTIGEFRALVRASRQAPQDIERACAGLSNDSTPYYRLIVAQAELRDALAGLSE